MIIRSFANGFELADWTQEVNVIPNQWGLINSLGIFENVPVAEDTVIFQEVFKDGALIGDRVRGDRSNFNKDYSRKLHSFIVPHFPLDDYISPKDLKGRNAYESLSEAEQLASVRARKMERIRQNHAWTLEAARAQVITAGTAYAPNSTISQDWFSEFSKSRTTVDFAFTTTTTNVISRVEAVIAAIQDNAGSVSMSGVVCLCSAQWFAALIAHAYVQTAYQYYTSTQQVMRDRMAEGGSATAMHREFTYGGVRFIEMRDAYNGTKLIPDNEAYAIPTGTDFFKSYFAPAERFGLVNTLGQEVYMFETANPNGTQIDIQTESNHISGCMKPDLMVKLTKS